MQGGMWTLIGRSRPRYKAVEVITVSAIELSNCCNISLCVLNKSLLV